MDNKFYVSLEAAMLLREKGYDKPTDYIYVIDGPFYSIWRNKDGYMESNYYPAPTKAEAIDWLESKGIIVEVPFVRNKKWRFSLYKGDCFYMDSWIHDRLDFSTRLEAEEAAIIKALELL